MSALELLARRCGIGITLTDGCGGMRDVPRATLEVILRALGLAVETDDDINASLAALDRRPWQTALAPTTIAREGAVAVELTLPEATREIGWRVLLEDGTERAGSARFSSLELLARDDVDCRVGRRKERRHLKLGDVPLGYHRVAIEPHDSVATLIVVPARCHLPPGAGSQRYWGLSLQLYLLRSARNLGLGDYGDLASLCEVLARRGCDVVGLNPLHAPFPDVPEHASPYSPASRLLLNPLNIDIASLPEVRGSPAASALLANGATRAEIEHHRAAEVLEYAPIAALKERVLRLAFADWRAAGGESSGEFAAFRAKCGTLFERHCLYFALRAHMLVEGLAPGDWHCWPQPYQDSRGALVARFARTNAADVTWVAWQQWLADRQLGEAARRCAPMHVGLYRDLAVGADAAGAETWAERESLLEGLNVGAPPDPGNAMGQEWGLRAPHPARMRAAGYRGFVELLRANMRHAGALRIDHAMALQRLFVVPHGASPADGAYLEYPVEELTGILALESVRAGCVIVGEDLGLVPPGFRERLAAANVLSYRVLRFENDAGRPTPPERYPPLAVAVFGNHDLPTLRGWWNGADLPPEQQALLDALRREGLLGANGMPSFPELSTAVHAWLGRTRALFALAQLDDVLGERLPVNVPGDAGSANWRRRHALPIEELERAPLFERITTVLATQRLLAARRYTS